MIKPIAWMMVNRENESAYLTFETPTRDMKISHEPHELYTHPHKELSDEEISLLKAEIEAHKKTNQLLAQKIVELEEWYKR